MQRRSMLLLSFFLSSCSSSIAKCTSEGKVSRYIKKICISIYADEEWVSEWRRKFIPPTFHTRMRALKFFAEAWIFNYKSFSLTLLCTSHPSHLSHNHSPFSSSKHPLRHTLSIPTLTVRNAIKLEYFFSFTAFCIQCTSSAVCNVENQLKVFHLALVRSTSQLIPPSKWENEWNFPALHRISEHQSAKHRLFSPSTLI